MDDLRYAMQSCIVPPAYIEVVMSIGLPLDGGASVVRTRTRDRRTDTQLGLNVLPIPSIFEPRLMGQALAEHLAKTIRSIHLEYCSEVGPF